MNKESQIFVSRLLPAHGFWQFCLSRSSQEWQLPRLQQAKLVIALGGSHDIFQLFAQVRIVQGRREFVLDYQLCLHHLQVSAFMDNTIGPPSSHKTLAYFTFTFLRKRWRPRALLIAYDLIGGSFGVDWTFPLTVGFVWITASLEALTFDALPLFAFFFSHFSLSFSFRFGFWWSSIEFPAVTC